MCVLVFVGAADLAMCACVLNVYMLVRGYRPSTVCVNMCICGGLQTWPAMYVCVCANTLPLLMLLQAADTV